MGGEVDGARRRAWRMELGLYVTDKER